MKGVIFNLLEEALDASFGEGTWDELLDKAGVDGVYTSLGDYPDGEVEALVAAGSAKLGIDRAAVFRWFGEVSMPLLRERYPSLFEGHASSRDFVLAVNSTIHPEVRKLYSGAACPYFRFSELGDKGVTMRYQSSRDMIGLAHGFVVGAAKLWDEDVSVRQVDADVLEIRW